MGEKLASISEYGENSIRSSLTGLSTYTGYSPYPRSPSGGSLSTLASSATVSRQGTYSRNGLPGERKIATENALQQRLRQKSSTNQKQNYEVCKKIRVTMALLGILLLVAAIFMLSFYLPKQYAGDGNKDKNKKVPNRFTIFGEHLFMHHDTPLQVNFTMDLNKTTKENDLRMTRPKLETYFGQALTKAAKNNYSRTVTNESITMSFQELDLDLTTLTIKMAKFSNQCYEIYWLTKYHSKLKDCFGINSTHWFGLGEVLNQKWPVDKVSFKMTPFLTSDYLDDYQPNIFGPVLEPFIVNSKGAGIYIDDKVPLHVSMNDGGNGKFCVQADHYKYNMKYENQSSTNFLNYTICIGSDIMKVYDIMTKQFIKKPQGVPDKRMFTQPIWSTWAKFKKNINQSVIVKFVKDIEKHNFTASHIEIDDKYQVKYGDYNFDPTKFEDVTHMIDVIRSLGFRVTAWVFPFANLQSKVFLSGLSHWMKVGAKEVPGITKWWNGMGGIVDTTNAASRAWFIKRLQEFSLLKIDGFKFDAGEVNYLPENYVFSNPQPNPNYFSKYYVELASAFSGLSEVRVAYKSQQYPIFVRMLDRSSIWKTQNGLQSVLTATLTFGILGYPFVLPDMVGGNAYIGLPNKELYIRWAQLCAFLPAIQFSIAPWEFDNEVVEMVHEALAIRKNMSELIYNAAQQASITGAPIVRPLWWYWPNDHETFVVSTEFMLADKYLIAPVVHFNIISHVIYLPAGVWQEEWGERTTFNMTVGGFRQYNVTLRDICYFRSVQKFV